MNSTDGCFEQFLFKKIAIGFFVNFNLFDNYYI